MSLLIGIQGTCPACGDTGSLFVGQGGHVTCARRECPDPGVVDDLLHRPRYHVLEVDGHGDWALQHAVTCFPNLLDCDVHRALAANVLAPEGRYRLSDDMRLTPLEDGR